MTSPTLAMEQLMLHPRYREFVELVRQATPVHIRDQADAATDHAADVLRQVGALISDEPIRLVNTGEVPGWLRLGVLDAFVGFLAGTAATCMHNPHPSRPYPVFAAVWKPGLIACASCVRLLSMGHGTIADRTCDCCGKVCAGVEVGDGIYPGMVQIGTLTVQYGACTDCHAEARPLSATQSQDPGSLRGTGRVKPRGKRGRARGRGGRP